MNTYSEQNENDGDKECEDGIFSFQKSHGAVMDHPFKFLHKGGAVGLLLDISKDQPGDK